MEPYTLDRNFQKLNVIDGFHSLIWTERYYGNSDVEIVVPKTSEMLGKLPLGVFLSIAESDEVMILETRSFDEPGKIKLTGISLLPWLNNRFIRTSPNHEDRYWSISGMTPGETLAYIIQNMCIAGSPYLDGTIDTGVIDPSQLVIPGLVISGFDSSGDPISVGVPFGPVYDAARDIAISYEVGMQVTLDEVTESSYTLGFRSYRGVDRTSLQEENSLVRFSPQIDSFANIKELESIAILKTLSYVFAPGNPDGLAIFPGTSTITPSPTGFDLRAIEIFAEDITTDMVEGDETKLTEILISRSRDALIENRLVKAVDGEIVPNNQYVYNQHYGLGDIVEVQGNTGTVETARVTEYIRAQDVTGIKNYPTVVTLGDIITAPGPPVWDWELVDSDGPETAGSAMDWDPVRGKIVMFGGADVEGTPSDKTYTWEGDHWEELEIDGDSPPARSLCAMTWDPIREEMILYGGYPDLDDTWALSGNVWTQKSDSSIIGGAADHSMAWSDDDDMIILGSIDDGVAYGWNGTEWLNMDPYYVPYDGSYAGRMVTAFDRTWLLFGLDDNDLTFVSYWDIDHLVLGDLRHSWEDIITTTTPSGAQRGGFACAYVPGLGIVIWGGYNYFDEPTDTTWIFNGIDWSQFITEHNPGIMGPSRFGQGIMAAYDPIRKQLVMHGTQNSDFGRAKQTWVLHRVFS